MQQAAAQIPLKNLKLFVQQAVGEIALRTLALEYPDLEIGSQAVTQLPWGHLQGHIT